MTGIYLSKSSFLAKLTAPKVKSEFKSRDHVSNS